MILDTIAASTRKRVDGQKKLVSPEEIKRRALAKTETETEKGGNLFREALGHPGVSFICEVKKASPSKGLIAPHFPYKDIAKEYEAAGADAISVLTEPEFFLGSSRYLEEIHQEVKTPLLRKDFTIDEYQIYEAKVLGASAVLLICALLGREQLKEYLAISRRLGLAALVEAHTDEEVEMAAEAGASIIGINNRNLKTFEVDFSNALRLRKLVKPGTIFVAESGIKGPEDIKALAAANVDAVLIGETLMRAENRGEMLKSLRQAAERGETHGAL